MASDHRQDRRRHYRDDDRPQAPARPAPGDGVPFARSLLAVVAATGASLLAGARFSRWYWLGLQIGVAAAAVFVHWLIVQSLYVLGALCPYCMVVWARSAGIGIGVINPAATRPVLPSG